MHGGQVIKTINAIRTLMVTILMTILTIMQLYFSGDYLDNPCDKFDYSDEYPDYLVAIVIILVIILTILMTI